MSFILPGGAPKGLVYEARDASSETNRVAFCSGMTWGIDGANRPEKFTWDMRWDR